MLVNHAIMHGLARLNEFSVLVGSNAFVGCWCFNDRRILRVFLDFEGGSGAVRSSVML